jgi:hypothetical protein
MGNLKPGATYVYERANGVTYARESGADPDTRVPIGWDYDTQVMMKKMANDIIWADIFEQAESNMMLRKELDRIIMLYYLGKDHGSKT